ncbi:MAG: hypothetical protein GF311_27260 [Candidatus Lokiarchaeota archaeon]|nr:hypothetical protein [Candidatus Lokiarchaeota archaeon]
MTAIVKNILTDKLPEISQLSFVIDGANIAYELKNSRNKPQLSNIKTLMNKLDSMELTNYKIICDNSLRYHIDKRKGYYSFIKQKKIIETPSGAEADVFILQYAYDNQSYIISNDKFRDYFHIFDKKWIKKMRMSFVFINNEIYLDKLIKLTKIMS